MHVDIILIELYVKLIDDQYEKQFLCIHDNTFQEVEGQAGRLSFITVFQEYLPRGTLVDVETNLGLGFF
jgi:hypothetical protein